jgi:hypothetical protein
MLTETQKKRSVHDCNQDKEDLKNLKKRKLVEEKQLDEKKKQQQSADQFKIHGRGLFSGSKYYLQLNVTVTVEEEYAKIELKCPKEPSFYGTLLLRKQDLEHLENGKVIPVNCSSKRSVGQLGNETLDLQWFLSSLGLPSTVFSVDSNSEKLPQKPPFFGYFVIPRNKRFILENTRSS